MQGVTTWALSPTLAAVLLRMRAIPEFELLTRTVGEASSGFCQFGNQLYKLL